MQLLDWHSGIAGRYRVNSVVLESQSNRNRVEAFCLKVKNLFATMWQDRIFRIGSGSGSQEKQWIRFRSGMIRLRLNYRQYSWENHHQTYCRPFFGGHIYRRFDSIDQYMAKTQTLKQNSQIWAQHTQKTNVNESVVIIFFFQFSRNFFELSVSGSRDRKL